MRHELQLIFGMLFLVVFMRGVLAANPCVITCGPEPGCSVYLQTNITDYQITQGQVVSEVRIRYQILNLGADCTCALEDCYMGVADNQTMSVGGQYRWPEQDEVDLQARCVNGACALPASTTYKKFNITGAMIGENKWVACLAGSQIGVTSGCTVKGTAYWLNVTRQDLNVSLIEPLANLNTTNKTVNFYCGANKTIDNTSLYTGNGATLNYSESNNLSEAISFDNTTTWSWSCKSAFSNLYNWNWGGNRTLIVWIPWFVPNISNPTNNTDISDRNSTTGAWYNFSVNATATANVSNISIYINGTLNRTVNDTNISINISGFTLPGVYYWYVMVCKDGTCRPNANGNATFSLQERKCTVNQWNPPEDEEIGCDYYTILASNLTGCPTELVGNMNYYVNKSLENTTTQNATTTFYIYKHGIYDWQTEYCLDGRCYNGSISQFSHQNTGGGFCVQPPSNPLVNWILLNLTGIGTKKNYTINFSTSDSQTNVTDWRLDNISIAQTYTFDTNESVWGGSIDGTQTDYSTYRANFNYSMTPPIFITGGCLKGGCYDFTDYQDLWINTSSTQVLEQKKSFTVALWFKRDTTPETGDQYLWRKLNVTRYTIWGLGFTYQAGFPMGAPNEARTIIRICEDYESPPMTTIIAESTWTLFTLSYDDDTSTARVYLNGTIESTINGVNTDCLNDINWGEFSIGNTIRGPIDELKIFNFSLNQSQIQSIYEQELRNVSWTTLDSQFTECNQYWSVGVTPNDFWKIGTTVYSEEVMQNCSIEEGPAATLNITLIKPTANYRTVRKMPLFQVQWTGIQPDNITINLSGTPYYTLEGGDNISVNLPLNTSVNASRNLSWNAYAMLDGQITESWNGPQTILSIPASYLMLHIGT